VRSARNVQVFNRGGSGTLPCALKKCGAVDLDLEFQVPAVHLFILIRYDKSKKKYTVIGLTIIFAAHFNFGIMIINSGEEINKLVNHSDAVLLYFFSDSCAPCVSLRPKVEQMMQEEFPRMQMAYVDAMKHPELAAEFNAFGLPVLVFFFEGKEFLRFSKYVSTLELKESIGRIYALYYS